MATYQPYISCSIGATLVFQMLLWYLGLEPSFVAWALASAGVAVAAPIVDVLYRRSAVGRVLFTKIQTAEL
jgi:hypothetical protein